MVVSSSQAPLLVTGAGGFVGSNLVNHLLSLGHPVRAMIRNPAQAAALEKAGAQVVVADLGDLESMRRAVRGVAGIYHIAALFRQAGLPDAAYREVNVEGTRRLLDLAVAERVPRFIHCSTVGVLGDIQSPPADEQAPYNPGDIYQSSKKEGEELALDYFRSGRIPGSVIRPAMIYGPGDTRTHKLFNMVAKGAFFYVGSGDTLMHFVDVRDLARCFQLAMEHTERNGEVYIAAGRQAVSLRELVEFTADYLQVPRPWIRLPVRPMQWLGSACEALCTPLRIQPPIFRRRVDFYTKNRCFNGAKAAAQLGFAAEKTGQQEIIEIIDWYWRNGRIRPHPRRHACQGPDHSFMLRSLEGDIAGWNGASETMYGFRSREALGAISHTLLKTEFPQPLDTINRELKSRRVWRGRLLHTTAGNKQVEVESHWLLAGDAARKSDRVLEINASPGGIGIPGILSGFAGFLSLGEVLAAG